MKGNHTLVLPGIVPTYDHCPSPLTLKVLVKETPLILLKAHKIWYLLKR